MILAAVLREINHPLEIEELEVAEPGAGEVMVRLAASGTCHSDLHCINGEWAETRRPIVHRRRRRYAFEAIGLKTTIEQAIAMLGPAGAAVLVGMPPDGVTVEVDSMAIASSEQRILGLHRRCRLDLDSVVYD